MNLLSRVQLFATPWTVAYQAPPSMGFPRQEYWSGLPLPSPLPSNILVSVFSICPTNKDIFLDNQNTVIKIRNLTLIYNNHIITLRAHTRLADCPYNNLCSRRIQFRTSCIWFLSLLTFFQSETVPQAFLNFHDLDTLEDYKNFSLIPKHS